MCDDTVVIRAEHVLAGEYGPWRVDRVYNCVTNDDVDYYETPLTALVNYTLELAQVTDDELYQNHDRTVKFEGQDGKTNFAQHQILKWANTACLQITYASNPSSTHQYTMEQDSQQMSYIWGNDSGKTCTLGMPYMPGYTDNDPTITLAVLFMQTWG